MTYTHFLYEVYKALGSLTIISNFCGVVLQMLISIGIWAFYHAFQLQMSSIGMTTALQFPQDKSKD